LVEPVQQRLLHFRLHLPAFLFSREFGQGPLRIQRKEASGGEATDDWLPVVSLHELPQEPRKLLLGDSGVLLAVPGALLLPVVQYVPPLPLHWSKNGDVQRLEQMI